MIGFIVMQIGDAQLDRVCEQVIVPALETNGLTARRVDKHNEGGLLKSEIVQFINTAEIIVADLTNARPNVYLEIGYAMGIDKFRNLILTVRQDHFLDHEGRDPNGPRVHFDLGGYDILPWDPEDLPSFESELTKRIGRRLALVGPSSEAVRETWDDEWITTQREAASPGLQALKHSGRMEIRAVISPPKPSRSLQELKEAARQAPIKTFGWPIGVFLNNVEESRPRPSSDGIVASVAARFEDNSYDFWALRRNGDFFLAKSIFEDEREPEQIFFNIRIVRVTEALMYCLRLYAELGVDRSSKISIAIRHSGLHGRNLGSSTPNRYMSVPRTSEVDEIESEISGTLDEIEANLVEFAKQVLAPLFELFDFFELDDQVYDDIITGFVSGRVT